MVLAQPTVIHYEALPQVAIEDYLNDMQLFALYFVDEPIMHRIGQCESGNRQFNSKGQTIVSPTNDFGRYQINQYTWDSTAREMNLDYKGSEIDNYKMARHVLDVQGLSAWACLKLI